MGNIPVWSCGIFGLLEQRNGYGGLRAIAKEIRSALVPLDNPALPHGSVVQGSDGRGIGR
jgi:hypothetical protein